MKERDANHAAEVKSHLPHAGHSASVCTVKKQNDQHEADVIKLTELCEEDKNQQEATRGRMTNLEWRSRGGHSAS